ncbi:ferritin-like domain-containing protein [Thermoanaerobacterium thermosaccharolyticum]|uniref:Rubrerythrin n=1 Tax=Thermoanaerobacterium thermosaccharolyticum (strain ATCC 7956 / DSM 571 / NCIMB 9385 / NCA 3814 / NCTC 13789 / WDCM 00135 / 2032) TaxID=580327 RepID=D9TPM7_THETC|nr:ferritin family protein [Thermoanaerobacterium thermosaccharolyticum]ADL67809.1 Rubrerythrin [Thermoanaerobacterium thermosaccharolyticum DSM 571]MBE0068227.1 ferritin family protein [Thermoanaerobacterium thermosaccharolyticum]MBE0228122.1 ferritin family protein [Thermoanaerobacterium thermosaccharolyticum]MCP2240450.1 rubrerythrin [Thermoanaerobacterium thermosaccharolyticum]
MSSEIEKKYLTDLEVVSLAIDIEDRGYEFYTMASEKFSNDKKIKEFFDEMAREELIHKSKFEELYRKLLDEKKGDDSAYFDIEASIYLTMLYKTSVFPSENLVEEVLKNVDTIYDAIELAIRAEKDSILFYDEIVKEAKFDATKRIVITLLNEEIKHFIDLSNKLKEV